MDTTHVDEIGSGPGHVLDYLSYPPIFSGEGNVGAGSKPALLQNRSPDNFHPIATRRIIIDIFAKNI